MNKILRFEITDRCNQKCKMCWSKDWNHCDMDWEYVKELLIDFSTHEPEGVVVLTSREPLLSPIFLKTLEFCTELGLDIKILTNGTLLTKDISEIIVKNNVSFVGVSLHGNSQQHDSIVNVTGAYEMTIKGIENLITFKEKYEKETLEIRITSVINELLKSSIEEIVELSSSLGVQLRLQHLMWHSESAKKNNQIELKEEFDISDDIICGFPSNSLLDGLMALDFVEKAKKLCLEKNVDLQLYPNLNHEEILDWYNLDDMKSENKYCDHCTNSIRVRANGEVTLCQYIDLSIGNVKDATLSEIIYKNSSYAKMCKNLEKGKLFPICYRCCHGRNNILLDNSHNYRI